MDTHKTIAEYLTYLQRVRNYATLTITRHQRVAKLWSEFLQQRIGVGLLEARADDVLSWIDYRREQGTVNDASINAELCVIRTLYEYLVIYEELSFNPASAVPELVCAPPPEQDYLSVEECFRLLEVFDRSELKGLRDYLMVALFWSTGLRKRELRALNCGDVNFDEAYVVVRKGKGGKQRQVFLNDRILEDLKVYRERWGWPSDQAPLFRSVKPDSTTSNPLKRLTASRIEEVVRKAGRKAGIDKAVCPLALRHSFATHMYEAGVSIEDIKEIMGHETDTETTIYVHVTIEAVRSFLNNHIANHPAERRNA